MARYILSRTDGIGDVILTLPMVGFIKERDPDAVIFFIGKEYTTAIVEACPDVDHFIPLESVTSADVLSELNADAIVHVFPNKILARLAARAKIPIRIGTSHRLFHWFTCNRRVHFSRKNSSLHESQLNFKLLAPLLSGTAVNIEEISSWARLSPASSALPNEVEKKLLVPGFKLLIHPLSHQSATEWGLDRFSELAKSLLGKNITVFVSGTSREQEIIQKSSLFDQENVVDVSGTMDLAELLLFISRMDGVIAASTGPLHMAAVLNLQTLGLYPPLRPMDPGRWGPLGERAHAMVGGSLCKVCTRSPCPCIRSITAQSVVDTIERRWQF